ncbi:DUF2815 family protein [Youngiibacter fragilis]|uniref:Phage protein n=1 Tax=Youngiibacter fragilis 232.1 TaxID=994573 RepID=V7I546_9CLOT|nr:DUF2815 family protein [Youngiibacter fragilis]ETA81003.1 hypothetical protein T472_0208835 [Youngiibacter fragilis 232.1]
MSNTANKTNSNPGKSPTKVITGIVRLSYANVWEPKSINGGAEKFSVSLIIPKSDVKTLSAINGAIDAAIEEGKGKFGGKVPNKAAIKLPLRDGDIDRPDDEAYADSYFINANSNTAPQVVDKNVNPILDRSEVYSGIYARVSINFYAFNSNGNKGIACGLGNIQKIRDGEPLGGRTNAADDFSTDVDDDFLS